MIMIEYLKIYGFLFTKHWNAEVKTFDRIALRTFLMILIINVLL